MAEEKNQDAQTPNESEGTERAEFNEEVQQANEMLQEENVAVTPEYEPEAEIDRAPEAETAVEEQVNEAFEAAAKAEDAPAVEAFDDAVEGVMDTLEENANGDVALIGEHHHSDTFTIPLLGAQMTLPGGIYTFVFGVLAILTVIEVAAAELMPDGALTIIILLAAAIAKALLVVTFYMHLANDNRIFRVVLLLPLIVVLLSVLFLLFVPVGGGLGYN
jgi:caa(3)-type oxidase subunit IV